MRVGKKAMPGYRWSAGMLAAAALSLLPTGPFVLDRAASHLEFFVKDNRGGFTGVAPAPQPQQGGEGRMGPSARTRTSGVVARSIPTAAGPPATRCGREVSQTDR